VVGIDHQQPAPSRRPPAAIYSAQCCGLRHAGAIARITVHRIGPANAGHDARISRIALRKGGQREFLKPGTQRRPSPSACVGNAADGQDPASGVRNSRIPAKRAILSASRIGATVRLTWKTGQTRWLAAQWRSSGQRYDAGAAERASGSAASGAESRSAGRRSDEAASARRA